MPSVPVSASLASVQRSTVRVLVIAQLLGAVGLAAGGTAGALLAQHLTGNTTTTGLPLAALVLGSGAAAVAVTRLMERAGRRVGLGVAHLAGALGAAVAVASAQVRNMPLLLAGCVLLGAGNTAVMLARYAAADLGIRPGRSISTVVAAASVGAIAGPNLLGPAGGLARRAGLPDAAGLFLLAIPAFLAAAMVLLAFLRPDPLHEAQAATGATAQAPSGARPTRTASSGAQPPSTGRRRAADMVLGHRSVRHAVLVLALTNLTMVAMMAVVPVHLHTHGAGISAVGLMVGAHIAAMYLPSPLTGWLADAAGGRTVAAAGAALLIGAGGVAALAGATLTGVMAALLLLGIGWNAGLIGGSAMLRAAPVGPSQRTRAEGIGELGMGAAAAAGGGVAGIVLAGGGFALLGVVAAAPCLLIFAVAAAPAFPRSWTRVVFDVAERPMADSGPHRCGGAGRA
jgi:MFS family permease